MTIEFFLVIESWMWKARSGGGFDVDGMSLTWMMRPDVRNRDRVRKNIFIGVGFGIVFECFWEMWVC